ncbi:MAG: tRNA pseudouridine(13) synthase TruD [Promethearchaeota archaeon]
MDYVQARDYDNLIGMRVFTTQSSGTGGCLRKTPEDFVVQEIGLDGSIAPLEVSDQPFPDQSGKLTAFFLVKRNIDSIQAIRHLSRSVGASYKRFSYAGMKDRRAVTSQRVSYRGPPQDLVGRDNPQYMILYPHRVTKPIVPGALKGNRFTILVRDVSLPAEDVKQRLSQIQNEIAKIGGVLNFFGPQRFGIMQPNTHRIGKELVLGNFEQAIHILLDTNDDVENDDEKALIREHSPQGTYERAITHFLNRHPGKFKESLKVLPKDLVRLYIHAYQSFLFNLTISERARQNIILREPIVGDYTIPISGEIHAVRPVTKENLNRVRQEVKNGTRQLVVPIIGMDFEHVPLEGEMGAIYHAVLESEQITASHFRLKDLPAFSSRGTFRPLLVNPDNLQITVLEDESDTPFRIQFDLSKGSYASVILREIIKPELSTQL